MRHKHKIRFKIHSERLKRIADEFQFQIYESSVLGPNSEFYKDTVFNLRMLIPSDIITYIKNKRYRGIVVHTNLKNKVSVFLNNNKMIQISII